MSKGKLRYDEPSPPADTGLPFTEVIVSHRKGIQRIEKLLEALNDLETRHRIKSKNDIATICLRLARQDKTEGLKSLYRLLDEGSVVLDMRLDELKHELQKLVRRHRFDFNLSL